MAWVGGDPFQEAWKLKLKFQCGAEGVQVLGCTEVNGLADMRSAQAEGKPVLYSRDLSAASSGIRSLLCCIVMLDKSWS